MFVKKRGVKMAAIVVDPNNNGQGDTTTDDASAQLKVKEIQSKLEPGAANFADLASQYSEDSSRIRGGELEYFPEDALKQYLPQYAAAIMSPNSKVGGITPAIPLFGKYYIFKLLERNDNDETITLDKPGTREQVNSMLGGA
jgi:parvulin-like peptidyl-prolyl isomerase